MFGDALPGTALASWLERVKADPEAMDATRDRIRLLMHDAGVAAQVQAGLKARSAAGHPAIVPNWLHAFVQGSDGALNLQFRLGAARRRIARLRLWVFGGASRPLVSLVGE